MGLKSLVSVHIAPLALPYDALLCNLNTEMINFEVTYTLCIGGVRFQSADGNEIRNLPVIDEPEDVKAKNGVIHAVNNLILPYQFSIENTKNKIDKNVDGGDAVNEISNALNDNNVTDSSDMILTDDFVESDVDGMNTGGTVIQDPISSSSAIMHSISEFVSDQIGTGQIIEGNQCQVCDNRELCAIPRSAVMIFPGEGELPCVNVVHRQNKGRGIIMGESMCKALKKGFKEHCLIGDGEN